MLDLDAAIELAEQQEQILQFPHFSRKDAWELGKILVNHILERNLVLSVSIRLTSGLVLFQYLTEGTTANNESWMTRKFNVVRELETSSLLNMLRLKKRNQSLENKGLDPKFYAMSGGAFPIRLKGSGLIGAVAASGLPHLADHDAIISAIGRFLGIQNFPHIPLDAGV
ncbi:MAG: heme-binding protein [Treponema sp.]|jgi:uncharacterized protein (UPF0303 family)|nr:heme-binding protein [Treponema sp.]